jgi:glycosyltransferase involved in cell wall biosynthesis
MIEGRTILCFASGYDAPPTSKHHVMHLLAERNTVLWVNYHASRAPTASGSDLRHMARKFGQILHGLRNPQPHLYVLTPPVLPLPSQAWAKWLNRHLLVHRIRWALKRIRQGPVQVWSFSPDISYLLGHFGEEKVVYYCVDDFASFSDYNPDQVKRDESDLCRRADLVVTTSMALQNAKEPLNPNTILVRHGVDYEHFSRAVREDLPVPVDVKDIPHPILGFFGLIRDWVDLDLLAEVARWRPDWHIVLLGDSTVDLAPYRGVPNMHFLGRRPYAELPAYCRAFDVGLIPFKINVLTQSVNPIKFREYLTAGMPVVSTPLPEVTGGEKGVYLADSTDGFVHAVESALSQPACRAELSESMKGETWEGRLCQIEMAVTVGQPTREDARPSARQACGEPAVALLPARASRVCMLVTNPGVDDPRVCMEAEALAEVGYNVSVIGWDREADRDSEEHRNGVDYVRLKLHSTHGRGVVQSIYLGLFWRRVWPVVKKLRPDIIHCHDLDTLTIGRRAARALKARLVFDAHENFPDMMEGHLPALAVMILRWLEKRLVPKCDLLITVGNRLAEHYRSLGARRVVVVGNWKDPADFRFPPDQIQRTREELGLKNGVVAICFVANLGRERRLEPLLAAVAADKRFACVIGGSGSQADLVRRYAAENKNIIYLGRVQPDRVPLVTAACDVVYYGFDETNPNAQWSAPNKLYEAIAAGKPLLTGRFGEIGDTVLSNRCGILGDTQTKSGMALALEQLASTSVMAALCEASKAIRGTVCRDAAATLLKSAYESLVKVNRRAAQDTGALA